MAALLAFKFLRSHMKLCFKCRNISARCRIMLQTFVDTHRGVEGVACGRSVFVLKDESEASEGVV